MASKLPVLITLVDGLRTDAYAYSTDCIMVASKARRQLINDVGCIKIRCENCIYAPEVEIPQILADMVIKNE